jgi:2,3-bisphosphoglycerate-independent phosphoglycerate mutase
MQSGRIRRAALVILDGWGSAPAGPGNAISLANTPVWDGLMAKYPHTLLDASGEAVGLPAGIMGNSEVGHLTIGSGRVIYQDLSRINRAISDGTFFANPVLNGVVRRAKERGGSLHLMGLLSDAGVHSATGHINATARLAGRQGLDRVFIHAFTDGRDTPPTSGIEYVEELEAFLAAEGRGAIATVCGRYYAMDRDKRWERVKLAYDALVHGQGLTAPDAATAVRQSYDRDETDEFVLPTVIGADPAARAASRIGSNDGVVFFNFRPDRAREMCAALTQSEFVAFDRGSAAPLVDLVGMTEYDPELGLGVAFPKEEPKHVLAEVISAAGLSQLHIAETEKYAHVTFFFNGGREAPFPGEKRCLVPSPKDVSTYDQKPEMSAYGVVDNLRRIMAEDPVDFVVLNFANPDMVGHTGNIAATIAALEHVDGCLGRVVDILTACGAKIMVTSDHGNAEMMLQPDGSVDTAHSTDQVPLIVLEEQVKLREGAGLADIAPTVLCFLGLPAPAEMTGTLLC